VLAVPTAVIRRRRAVAALALLALAALVFGIVSGRGSDPGPLRWAGEPRTGMAGDQQVLYGTLVNRAKTPLRVGSADVRVLDGDGKRLTSSAAFSGGYVPAFASAARPVTVTLRPKGELALGVTWTGDAAQIRLAGSTLAVPK
jgi:hypothetical protein